MSQETHVAQLTKAEIITASRLYAQKKRFNDNQPLTKIFDQKIKSVISNFLSEVRSNRCFVLEVLSTLIKNGKTSHLMALWGINVTSPKYFLEDVACVLQANSGEIQEEEIFIFTELLVNEEDKEEFFQILFEILEFTINKFQSIN